MATVNTALELGEITNSLYAHAYEAERDPAVVTADWMDEVEGLFAKAVEGLWEVQATTPWFLHTVENMPCNFAQWFIAWLRQNEKQLPPLAMGGGCIWVIAPEL